MCSRHPDYETIRHEAPSTFLGVIQDVNWLSTNHDELVRQWFVDNRTEMKKIANRLKSTQS